MKEKKTVNDCSQDLVNYIHTLGLTTEKRVGLIDKIMKYKSSLKAYYKAKGTIRKGKRK